MTPVRTALAVVLLAGLAACSNDTSTPVSPTSVPPLNFTYATIFTANGSVTRTFEMISPGTVTMTLTSVTPDVPLGLGVGIPTVGASSGCSLTRSLVTRAGGSPQITIPAEPGLWCVRVWDPGTVTTDRVSFSLSVQHN